MSKKQMSQLFARLDSSKLSQAKAKRAEQVNSAENEKQVSGLSVMDLLSDDCLPKRPETNPAAQPNQQDSDEDLSQEQGEEVSEQDSVEECSPDESAQEPSEDPFAGLSYEPTFFEKLEDTTEAVYNVALIYGVSGPAYCVYKVGNGSHSLRMVSKGESVLEFFKLVDSIFEEILRERYLEVQVKASEELLKLMRSEEQMPHKVRVDYADAQKSIRFIQIDTQDVIKEAINSFV